MGGAPVVDGLDEAGGIQLGAHAEQGVARRGGVGTDVEPQRRIEGDGIGLEALAETFIETIRPGPAALDMIEGRFVIEGAVDGGAELVRHGIMIGLIGQLDEGIHRLRLQIVHQAVAAIAHAGEDHHLPLAGGDVPAQGAILD